MTQNLPQSLPKGLKRRLFGLSEQGLKNKQKRKNNRKNQWKGLDFVPFSFGKEQQKEEKSINPVVIQLERGEHDEIFKSLPSEIYFQICSYLNVEDLVVRELLLICSEITCKMLGISSLKEVELEKVKLSPYYELLTFLAIRNEIERFSTYSNGKKKFICKENDLESQTNFIKTEWNWTPVKQQFYIYYSDDKDKLKRNIRNPKSEFSASKVFYRLENAIKELNKYFPHWLSSREEFKDMSIMGSFIKRHRNIESLYETLVNVKKVGIPVVSYGDEEFQFNENLDMKLNSILFDSTRFKSGNRHVIRNWKLMFEKQMEKRIHLDFTEQVLKWTKFFLLQVRESHQLVTEPLEEIIRLATKMEERKRYFYLFERNYAHGDHKIVKTANKRPNLAKPKANDFVSLYQHIIGRIGRVRITPDESEVFVKFTHFMIEQWKQFYVWKRSNSSFTDNELVYYFLLDGPRQKFTNYSLLVRYKLLDNVMERYPTVLDEYFPQKVVIINEEILKYREVPINKEILRNRLNGKFKD